MQRGGRIEWFALAHIGRAASRPNATGLTLSVGMPKSQAESLEQDVHPLGCLGLGGSPGTLKGKHQEGGTGRDGAKGCYYFGGLEYSSNFLASFIADSVGLTFLSNRISWTVT